MNKILVVDDHPIVRAGVMRILSAAFKLRMLREAQSADEAILALSKARWDIVIADISMPGKSGVDLLRYVRLAHPTVPLLFLSIHPEHRYAAQAKQLGASGYLQKDSVVNELCMAVTTILRGQEYWSVNFRHVTPERRSGDLAPLHHKLTTREFEIFYKLGRGESVTHIADELCLSVQTVSTYRSRILTKLNMSNNADIMHYAMRNALADRNDPCISSYTAQPGA